MKVKFDRMRIIAALRKSKAEAVAQYEKQQRDYPVKLNNARERYIQNVTAYLQGLKRASKSLSRYNWSDTMEKGVEWPDQPKEPNLEKVDALIEQLGLSDEETILCDTKEDYIALTRVCNITGCCKR